MISVTEALGFSVAASSGTNGKNWTPIGHLAHICQPSSGPSPVDRGHLSACTARAAPWAKCRSTSHASKAVLSLSPHSVGSERARDLTFPRLMPRIGHSWLGLGSVGLVEATLQETRQSSPTEDPLSA